MALSWWAHHHPHGDHSPPQHRHLRPRHASALEDRRTVDQLQGKVCQNRFLETSVIFYFLGLYLFGLKV